MVGVAAVDPFLRGEFVEVALVGADEAADAEAGSFEWVRMGDGVEVPGADLVGVRPVLVVGLVGVLVELGGDREPADRGLTEVVGFGMVDAVLGCDEVLPELVEGSTGLVGVAREEEVAEAVF